MDIHDYTYMCLGVQLEPKLPEVLHAKVAAMRATFQLELRPDSVAMYVKGGGLKLVSV